VYRSGDGGRHWAPVGLPPSSTPRTITAIAVFAGGNGALYVAGLGIGVLRSEDSGQRWRLMDAGPRGGITRLVHSNMPGSMQSGWLFVAGPQGVRRNAHVVDHALAQQTDGRLGGHDAASVEERGGSPHSPTYGTVHTAHEPPTPERSPLL
jgi:photosystem II stability/assembly factor-like uncharacterized protein